MQERPERTGPVVVMTIATPTLPTDRAADMSGVDTAAAPTPPPLTEAQLDTALRICRAAARKHRAVTRGVVELGDVPGIAWPLLVRAARSWDPERSRWVTWVYAAVVRDLRHRLDSELAAAVGCSRTALDVAGAARRRLDASGTPVSPASLAAATAAALPARGLRDAATIRMQAEAAASAVLGGGGPRALDAMPVPPASDDAGPEEQAIRHEEQAERRRQVEAYVERLVELGRSDLADAVRRAVVERGGVLPSSTLVAVRRLLAAA